MEKRDYLIFGAALFLSTGAGFLLGNLGEEGFDKQVDVSVDSETPTESLEFDGNFLELRYEDTDRAKFYFKFNDTREVQQIEGTRHDGALRRTKEIRSFGNQTYILHLKYQDNADESDDGFFQLYRIEEV